MISFHKNFSLDETFIQYNKIALTNIRYITKIVHGVKLK